MNSDSAIAAGPLRGPIARSDADADVKVKVGWVKGLNPGAQWKRRGQGDPTGGDQQSLGVQRRPDTALFRFV